MALTRTFQKHKVFVTQAIPNMPDVISRVFWSMTYSDGVLQSQTIGETPVDIEGVLASQDYSNLLNVNTATEADIEAMCLRNISLDQLEEKHAQILKKKRRTEFETVQFDDGLVKQSINDRATTPPAVARVSMRQARLALHQQNLLSLVEDAINLIPEPDKTKVETEWQYASTVERSSPWVAILQPALGLTDQQMDDLFALAATL